MVLRTPIEIRFVKVPVTIEHVDARGAHAITRPRPPDAALRIVNSLLIDRAWLRGPAPKRWLLSKY